MKLLSSLTNRIFFGSALLTVVAIGIAVYNVNVAVTSQAEQELRRGLDEAWRLIEENRGVLVEHFTREARLVADLPRLKATVDTKDPPTVQPIAEAYQQQLEADLFLVTHRTAGVLARLTSAAVAGGSYDALPGVQAALAGREASSFWPHPGGILQVVSVPIWGAPPPEILGTLSVGFSLDKKVADRFRELTNSDVAFGMNGAIQVSSLPAELWPALTPLLAKDGLSPVVPLGGNEYIALTLPLRSPDGPAAGVTQAASTSEDDPPRAIILRSRTERLRFLDTLHTSLLVTAVVAVLAATLLSYAIARTVTRPLGTITATMRDMAATGDLTRKIPLTSTARWEDEDARLLATTFNTMTESIARFQREAAQRERLSSLGRLSTIVAHEIRNPLMIIKAALRGLRQNEVPPATLRAVAADIDEEIARLNRIVTEVLDFARPIKFELGRVDPNALCKDAVRASGADGRPMEVALRLDASLPPIVTDAERLRLTLVNILGNARLAVAARPEAVTLPDAITLSTARIGDSRLVISVRDRGAGIAPEDLPRVFDPYFTTRQTGTGLGLAISKNIIEGLGGTITVSSRRGEGTDVRIELPVDAPGHASVRT